MSKSGVSLWLAKGRRRSLCLSFVIVMAAIASGTTPLTPAVADEPPSCEELPVMNVHVDPGRAPQNPEWSEACYRGIRPSDNLILSNPHRGLRLQLGFDASEVTAASAQSALVAAERQWGGRTRVTQLHFSLKKYVGSNIPESAKKNMQAVFDELKNAGYTVVLGFTYDDENNSNRCAEKPEYNYTLDDIKNHLTGLKALLAENAGLITSWEAGFVGAWGEWGPSCSKITQDPTLVNELMRAIVETAPAGVGVMMRYPWHRSWVDPDIRSKIGFHNNLFSPGYVENSFDFYNPYRYHYWIGTDEDGHDLPQGRDYFFGDTVRSSPDVMLDAEMAWDKGTPTCTEHDHNSVYPYDSNPDDRFPYDTTPYHASKGLDWVISAQRLQSMHYTTLSRSHNVTTFNCWRGVPPGSLETALVTKEALIKAGLPFDDAYFQTNRNAYGYIRDHLGYRLRLTDAGFGKNNGGRLPVRMTIANDGFSAPHIPRTAYLVLLDQDGEIVSREALDADWTTWKGLCSTEYEVAGPVFGPNFVEKYAEWKARGAAEEPSCADPEYTVEGSLRLTGLPEGTYSVGFWLPDEHDALKSDGDYAVRLANGNVRWSERTGVNVIATINATGTRGEGRGGPAS